MSMPFSSLIREYQSKLGTILRISDVFLLFGILWCAVHIRGIVFDTNYWLVGVLGCFVFGLIGSIRNLYRFWRGMTLLNELVKLLTVWSFTCAILLMIGFSMKQTTVFSRIVIGLWFAMVPLALIIWRMLFRYSLRLIRKRGYAIKRVAIAGTGTLGMEIAKVVRNEPTYGFKVVGFYDDMKPGEEYPPETQLVPVLGTLEDLITAAEQTIIDCVYITLPMGEEDRIRELVKRLSDTVVSVYIVPDFFVFNLIQARWMSISGIPAVSIFDSPFSGLESWTKRIEDIVVASLILIMCAIPMAVIAMVIKLTSEGPVLFKQRRYGVNGREVWIWKFRTMTVCEDGNHILQAKKDDPRVTPIGRFLRRISLDELPQFFNVLQGRMSVVGPRPHAVAHNEYYRKLIHGYMQRHKVRPGITGWAQVNGWRGETDTLEKMEKRVQYDMQYLRNWSVWFDLKVIFLTIFKGFTGKEAY
jgi:putative colanic acid biosynthesis UDP-glucose lipid carrier transferase